VKRDRIGPADSDSSRRELGATGAATAGAGASLVATAAAACCATPLIASTTVTLLGASGAAWAAGFEPYAPWMLGGAALALGYAYWALARAPRPCDAESRRARFRRRTARTTLGIATVLWLFALGLNLLRATPGAGGG